MGRHYDLVIFDMDGVLTRDRSSWTFVHDMMGVSNEHNLKAFMIAKEFITALQGRSGLLRKESAQEMAAPVEGFPWTGLGLFTGGENTLVSNGWGENGQCILKMKYDTEDISVVMTNRNPGMDQASSGVECLADNRCCLN